MKPVKTRSGFAAAFAALAPLLAALCWPELASACPVCTAGREEENRQAFLVTTLFLSLLPLSMVGGLVWWLRRRARQAAALEAALRPGTQAQVWGRSEG